MPGSLRGGPGERAPPPGTPQPRRLPRVQADAAGRTSWSEVPHPAALCRHALLIAPRTLIRRSRSLHAASDEALVAALRDGDDTAFGVIYDRHHVGLLGFCRHMLGSQPEAEDALQLVLLSAYHALRRDDRPIELKPWLYTIARNRCTSVLRARRDEQPIDDERQLSTTGLALADEVEQREDLRSMLGDVAALPDEQRAALVLAELGDITHEEIGVSLGVPTAKVKALVFQARSALIRSRRARDTPCEQIREQLATLRGSALRRGEITRHLETCAGCAAFGEEIRLQRAGLACVLPIAPALALKQQLLTGILASGAAGATAGGSAVIAGTGSVTAGVAGSITTAGVVTGVGAAGGTGMLATAGSSLGAAKILAAVVLAGGIVGGTVATERAVREPSRVPIEKRSLPPAGAAPASRPLAGAAPAATAVPGRTGAGLGRATKAPGGPATRGAAAGRRKAAARRREVREAARKARATSETAKGGGGTRKGTPVGPARAGAVSSGAPAPGRSGGSAARKPKRAPGAEVGSAKGSSGAAPARGATPKPAPPARAKQRAGSGGLAETGNAGSGRAGVRTAPTTNPKERKRANDSP